MRIAIVPGSCAPFHDRTLDERPLGGIESAVIHLARALEKIGHTIFVFSRFENPPLSKPLYLPLRMVEEVGEVDVLIAVRELMPIFLNVNAKHRYYWTGDSYDQLQHLGLGDKRVVERLTALLAVSDWQADALTAISGYPRERSYILRNGIDLSLFEGTEERDGSRLIYSSTPFRGLAHLPKLFQAVRSKVSGASLHVFSGFAVYDGSGINRQALEQQFEPIFTRLKNVPDVVVHGNIKQNLLAREFMRASILAYPNTFEETSCITAMEAMAAGCVVVTSNRGALPETVGDAGILLDGMPGTAGYDTAFVDAIADLLIDSDRWQMLSKRSRDRSQSCSWNRIAEDLTERLRNDGMIPRPAGSNPRPVASPIVR